MLVLIAMFVALELLSLAVKSVAEQVEDASNEVVESCEVDESPASDYVVCSTGRVVNNRS